MRIRKSFILTLVAGFVAVLSTASLPIFAASSSCAGASCPASVDLDFEVIIPAVVHIRIGDPVLTNTLSFDMTSAPQDVGNSVPQTGTGGYPDAGTSTVQFEIVANGGATTSVQINAGVTGGGGGLTCQSGDCLSGGTLAWDQIGVDGSGCGSVPPAQLDNNGPIPWMTYNAASGIINDFCDWVFTYDNTEVPVSGTYGGRVTYTAVVTP